MAHLVWQLLPSRHVRAGPGMERADARFGRLAPHRGAVWTASALAPCRGVCGMSGNEAYRVLLVDDSESDHEIIRRHLRKAQSCAFTLDWISDFDEAVAELRAARHDVCLLDYRLGPRSGLDLLLRAPAAAQCMPLIFLTGLGNLEVAVEAMRLGAIDYLDKNLLSAMLLERSLRYAIENFRVNRELRRPTNSLSNALWSAWRNWSGATRN